MSAKEIRYIPFTEKLMSAVLPRDSSRAENALYIFPTEASRQAALREFQPRWRFENIRFLTMEELKETLFTADKPLLREEKRTLAFYAALSNEDRQFFKIGNYFQSIELAQNFFDLWEEFNEELIPEDLYGDRLETAGAELLNWQKQTWERLVRIKSRYADFIHKKEMDDFIFICKPNRMRVDLLSAFESVHFVNQFYYTRLEKLIIDRLADAGKKAILYYQLPPELLDEDRLSIAPFSLRDLGAGRSERIDVIECKNEFAMLRAMLAAIDAEGIRHVINFSEYRNPYARLLSQRRFKIGGAVAFGDTSIYKFFRAAHALVESIVPEPTRKKLLLPLPSIVDALLDDAFSRTLFPDDRQARRRLCDYIYSLLDYDYRFVDPDGEFFHSVRVDEAVPLLQRLLRFVKHLLTLNSIDALVAAVDSTKGLMIDDMLTEAEKSLANIREAFYRALADFRSLHFSGVIDDWDALFENRRLAPQAQNAAGVLRLFLDYLKPRTVRYNLAAVETPRADFSSLQDTRNLAYKNVVVVNVVEKEIPHARQTPFLFSERQRKALGLKIYDDVKLREKYYLFRLVLTSPRVTLLTQKNIEQNIDVSSFVEEIRLYAPPAKLHEMTFQQEDYAGVYDQLLQPRRDYLVDESGIAKAEFYRLKLHAPHDFPQKSINLSYYALASLLDNPFAFYIQNIVRLQEKPKKAENDLSNKLIGNIVHEALNIIWRDILEQQPLPPFRIDFKSIPREIIDKALQKTLHTDRFYYAMPHNFSDIYFLEIMLPRISQGIRRFFDYLDRIGLSGKPLDIHPEKDEPLLRQAYIPFIKSDKIDFSINIGGRADLRIEAPENERFYIFDYKTGGQKKEQLILYELYYYLIEGNAPPERVYSYFYHILDAEGKELREFSRKGAKEEMIEQFSDRVRTAVRELWLSGFCLPEQKNKLQAMQDITRADLYRAKYLPLKNRQGIL